MSLSLVNWIVSLPDVSSLVCPARAEGGGGCRGRWFPRGCPSSWSLGVVGGRWAWESGNGEGAEALAYRVLEEVSTLSPWVAAFPANQFVVSSLGDRFSSQLSCGLWEQVFPRPPWRLSPHTSLRGDLAAAEPLPRLCFGPHPLRWLLGPLT